jgi:oxygen-independent coproporphyrinogen-3 oxidase
LQTVASFAVTLDKILSVDPDRFSIFNYAHLPARFKTQRQMNEADMPSAEVKNTVNRLLYCRVEVLNT